MAYQTLVYRTSGGDELVISAGASWKIGGVDGITTGGYIGDERFYYEKTTGTTGAITSYGYSVFAKAVVAAGGAANDIHYSVEPALGRMKYMLNLVATTSDRTVVLTTGTWDGTNKNLIFSTGATNPQSAIAIGISTSAWTLIHMTTGVILSNT